MNTFEIVSVTSQKTKDAYNSIEEAKDADVEGPFEIYFLCGSIDVFVVVDTLDMDEIESRFQTELIDELDLSRSQIEEMDKEIEDLHERRDELVQTLALIVKNCQ